MCIRDRYARYNKKYYDIKVHPKQFQPGQWVWYLNLRKALGKQQKWTSQYEGPYLILHVLSTHSIEIQKNSRTSSKVVHVDKLKLYEGPLPRDWTSSRPNPQSPSTPGTGSTPRTPLHISQHLPHPPRRQLEGALNGEPDQTTPSSSHKDSNVESGIGMPTQEEATPPADPTSPIARERPRRQVRRPSRFQDAAFETQFAPSQQGRRESQQPADESTIRLIGVPSAHQVERLVSPRVFIRNLISIPKGSTKLVSPRQFYRRQSMNRRPSPNQSNPWLPVRLVSPMIFYRKWIQQRKVLANTPTNRMVRVKLDDGDVRDQLPASAVRVQAESTPTDSTRSNLEARTEHSSASPTTPVTVPTVSVGRASTMMPLSNRDGGPENDRAARYDQAIDNDVQVVRDSRVSHISVPVIVGGCLLYTSPSPRD